MVWLCYQKTALGRSLSAHEHVGRGGRGGLSMGLAAVGTLGKTPAASPGGTRACPLPLSWSAPGHSSFPWVSCMLPRNLEKSGRSLPCPPYWGPGPGGRCSQGDCPSHRRRGSLGPTGPLWPALGLSPASLLAMRKLDLAPLGFLGASCWVTGSPWERPVAPQACTHLSLSLYPRSGLGSGISLPGPQSCAPSSAWNASRKPRPS